MTRVFIFMYCVFLDGFFIWAHRTLWYRSIRKPFWVSEICFYYTPSYASGQEAANHRGSKVIKERSTPIKMEENPSLDKRDQWANKTTATARFQSWYWKCRMILFEIVKATLDAPEKKSYMTCSFSPKLGKYWSHLSTDGNSQKLKPWFYRIWEDGLHFESRKRLKPTYWSKFLLWQLSQPAPSVMKTQSFSYLSLIVPNVYMHVFIGRRARLARDKVVGCLPWSIHDILRITDRCVCNHVTSIYSPRAGIILESRQRKSVVFREYLEPSCTSCYKAICRWFLEQK